MVRNIEANPGSFQVLASQQISSQTITALERQIDDAIHRKPDVVNLNLAGVQTIDSAGLNWLLATQTRLGGHGIQLTLQDPSALLHDVFLATRLDSRFKISCSATGEQRNG